MAQKEVQKALESLKTFNLTPKPRLISDLQTSLPLCCKPASTLALGTGLLVARVQDTFGGGSKESGLHYAPGSAFAHSVDLLTRYDRLLARKITPEFYAPSFLKPRCDQRITTPVALMKMIPEKDLPHRITKFMKYAMVPGGQRANMFAASPSSEDQTVQFSQLHSTGQGAMQVTVKSASAVSHVPQGC